MVPDMQSREIIKQARERLVDLGEDVRERVGELTDMSSQKRVHVALLELDHFVWRSLSSINTTLGSLEGPESLYERRTNTLYDRLKALGLSKFTRTDILRTSREFSEREIEDLVDTLIHAGKLETFKQTPPDRREPVVYFRIAWKKAGERCD